MRNFIRCFRFCFFLGIIRAFADDTEKIIVPIGLTELVNQVVVRNARSIYQNIEKQISLNQIQYERGIFDPSFYLNLRKERNHKPNNTQDALTRQFESEYTDQTDVYELGVRWLSRRGQQWSIDFSYDQHGSSVVDRFRGGSEEYTSGVDINLRQPLGKSKGGFATQIKINLAKIESGISIDEYRKALMELIGLTISNYWNLYGSLRLQKSWERSLDLIDSQLKDAKLRLEGGKANRSLILELEVGLSQRKIELQSVKSKIRQLHNQIFGLLSVSAAKNQNVIFETRDNPNIASLVIPDLELSYALAIRSWPELRIMKQKRDIELLKSKYAKEQLLPQFDLVGKIGSTSLDTTASRSLGQSFSGEFLSHYLGFEYKLPFYDIAAKENFKIAELRRKQVDLQIESMKRTLYNSLVDRIETLSLSKNQLEEFDQGLKLRRDLLKLSQERLKYGKISLRNHLEEEEKLIEFERKNFNAIVEVKISEASLEKAVGLLLDVYQVDVEEQGKKDELPEDESVGLFLTND